MLSMLAARDPECCKRTEDTLRTVAMRLERVAAVYIDSLQARNSGSH
jgi:hypothetical protein